MCAGVCPYTFLVLFLWLFPPSCLFLCFVWFWLLVLLSLFQLESCLFNERERKKKCGFEWAGGEDLVGAEEGQP